MKKLFFMMSFVFVFAFTVFADIAGVNAWGGFATLNMGAVNDEIDERYSTLSGVTPETKKIENSYIIGGDLFVCLGMGFNLGGRVSYIGNVGGYKLAEDDSNDDFMKYGFDVSMLSLMGGLSYNIVLPATPIKAGAGAFAGYGLAGGMVKSSSKSGSDLSDEQVSIGGGGLAAVISGELEYVVSNTFSFGLTAGYRIAEIAEMKAVESNSEMSYEKDEIVKDIDGSTLPFDFGGFEAGVQITLTY